MQEKKDLEEAQERQLEGAPGIWDPLVDPDDGYDHDYTRPHHHHHSDQPQASSSSPQPPTASHLSGPPPSYGSATGYRQPPSLPAAKVKSSHQDREADEEEGGGGPDVIGPDQANEKEPKGKHRKAKGKGKEKAKEEALHQGERAGVALATAGADLFVPEIEKMDFAIFLTSPDLSFFLEFLYAQQQDHLLLFWFACEDYLQNGLTVEARRSKVQELLEKHLSVWTA